MNGDVRALPRQRQRDGPTDASGRPGDERVLSRQAPVAMSMLQGSDQTSMACRQGKSFASESADLVRGEHRGVTWL